MCAEEPSNLLGEPKPTESQVGISMSCHYPSHFSRRTCATRLDAGRSPASAMRKIALTKRRRFCPGTQAFDAVGLAAQTPAAAQPQQPVGNGRTRHGIAVPRCATPGDRTIQGVVRSQLARSPVIPRWRCAVSDSASRAAISAVLSFLLPLEQQDQARVQCELQVSPLIAAPPGAVSVSGGKS